MKTLACPICEFELQYGDAPQDHPGLLGALGVLPSGLTPEEAQALEHDMAVHLEEHSVEDWVVAFAQADVYIGRLEAEKAELEQKLAAVDKMRRLDPGSAVLPSPSYLSGAPERLTNAAIAHREDARRLRAVDPDQTLIPVIPSDKREAGQVGRKTL